MTQSNQPEQTDTEINPAGSPEAETAAQSVDASAGQAASANAGASAMEEQLEAARREGAEHYNRYLRAVADLENYRRRVIREKEDLRQFAVSGLVEDLLPVVENLSLGLASARQSTDAKSVVDGVGMVLDQLKNVLGKVGLKEINPAPGETFDPHQHESISHLPSPDIAPEAIFQVARIGYSLNGRLLRPASVVLSSGPAKGGSRE